MPATPLQQQITSAILPVVANFNAAGTDTIATITRQDTAGVWQAIGTVTPVYLSQEEPSKLAQALAVAQVLRTIWKLYADTTAIVTLIPSGTATVLATLRVSDRLTWESTFVFLVTGIDLTDLPGAIVGTLERVLTS